MTRRSFFTKLFSSAAAGVGVVLLGWQRKRLRFQGGFRTATLPHGRWIVPILFKRKSD